MFSINTTEIRWFLIGKSPQELHSWLQAGSGLYEVQQPRTDTYLFASDCPAMGIKMREGRLEIKKRISSVDRYQFESFIGRPECWIKWSSQLKDHPQEIEKYTREPRHWIRIHKSRTVLKFSLGENGLPMLPPDTGYPQAGITLEITDIIIQNQAWWTFGLETFGEDCREAHQLLRLIPILGKGLPVVFKLEDSMGYPEWILRTT